LIRGVEDPDVPRDPKISAKMLKNRMGTTKVSRSSERLFFNRLKLTWRIVQTMYFESE
jgi:hypothetical protein